jgi:hypothetical protein
LIKLKGRVNNLAFYSKLQFTRNKVIITMRQAWLEVFTLSVIVKKYEESDLQAIKTISVIIRMKKEIRNGGNKVM